MHKHVKKTGFAYFCTLSVLLEYLDIYQRYCVNLREEGRGGGGGIIRLMQGVFSPLAPPLISTTSAYSYTFRQITSYSYILLCYQYTCIQNT